MYRYPTDHVMLINTGAYVYYRIFQVACECETANSNTWHETSGFVTITAAQPIDFNS